MKAMAARIDPGLVNTLAQNIVAINGQLIEYAADPLPDIEDAASVRKLRVIAASLVTVVEGAGRATMPAPMVAMGGTGEPPAGNGQ